MLLAGIPSFLIGYYPGHRATRLSVAALHHVSFNALQQWGFPAYCFTTPGWSRVVAHATYVVIEASVLCYIAAWLARDARQGAELAALVGSLVDDEERINLNVSEHRPGTEAARNLHGVLSTLSGAIKRVREHVLHIDQALGQMRHDNDAVSQGAETQANELAAVADSIRVLDDLLHTGERQAADAQTEVGQTLSLAREGSDTM